MGHDKTSLLEFLWRMRKYVMSQWKGLPWCAHVDRSPCPPPTVSTGLGTEWPHRGLSPRTGGLPPGLSSCQDEGRAGGAASVLGWQRVSEEHRFPAVPSRPSAAPWDRGSSDNWIFHAFPNELIKIQPIWFADRNFAFKIFELFPSFSFFRAKVISKEKGTGSGMCICQAYFPEGL